MNCNHCLFYVAGLLAAFAYDNISYKKVATQSHTSVALNAEASIAVDGSISTCMRTLDIGRTSPDKTVWWKVDLGEVYSIYSINILFKNYDGYVERQRGRFAGFSLYVSNADVSTAADIKASTLCYKDGLQLPPLNFTTVCTESARYVIFYNKRLDGVVYPTGYIIVNVVTELCEVIVQGCSTVGFYGSNCDTPCPTNCEDSTCHIQNGTCFTCKPGWTGIFCSTKCKEGWYGVSCSQQCSGPCRDGASCNHVTGHCDGGCEAGWTGVMCDKVLVCDEGYYGYNCVNTCSGHCLNSSPCNKQTGHCDKGCNSGYSNSDCSRECRPGYFGMNCMERCSGHCINNDQCDHVSGVCPSGCQDGYIGTFCNNSCTNGYYDTNCSRVCSPNCKPNTCRQTDGECSCSAGWTGYNCTTDVENYMIAQPSSNHLRITVGGTVGVGVCMFIIIGVVITISVKRRNSLNTKRHTCDLQFCWRSTSAAEPGVNTEDISNYQELNFTLEENPYQSISR